MTGNGIPAHTVHYRPNKGNVDEEFQFQLRALDATFLRVFFVVRPAGRDLIILALGS